MLSAVNTTFVAVVAVVDDVALPENTEAVNVEVDGT